MQSNEKPNAAGQSRPDSPSKRALLKAGWIAPVVVAMSLPTSSYAQNASGRGRRPWTPGPPPWAGPRG